MEPEGTEHLTYVIPARRITGSAPQILAEIDDMVEALQIVRETVVARAPKLARPPERSWGDRIRRALRLRQRAGTPANQASVKR
jgi:hypothetical protein